MLELRLPERQGGDAEDASADCAICYAYRLLPEAAASAPAAAVADEGDDGLGRAAGHVGMARHCLSTGVRPRCS